MTLISFQSARNEDLRDVVAKIVQEQKNSILDLFLVQDVAAQDTTHKWVDKKLKGYRDILQADVSNAATTLTLSAGAAKRIIDNTTYLKIDDELMKVTAGSGTNTLTVTRAQFGSAAAAHTAGAEVFFVSHLQAEGADSTRDDSQVGTKIFNYTQIFRRELKLSGTSQAVKSAGDDNAWANQVQELMKECLQELRLAALQGQRFANADESIRMMGGLSYFASNIDDEGGSPITTDMIDEKILTLMENGADVNNLVLLASGRQIKRINALKVARVAGGGMNQNDTALRNNVDLYEFSDALVKIIRVPELARNEIYLFDQGKFKIVPLQNRSFRVEDIGKVGDSVQKLLVGEYTCEVMNAADAFIHVKNLAV